MQTSFSVVGNADVHREMQTSFSVVKMVLYRSEGKEFVFVLPQLGLNLGERATMLVYLFQFCWPPSCGFSGVKDDIKWRKLILVNLMEWDVFGTMTSLSEPLT